MSDGGIFELLLIFDAISPSTIGLIGLSGVIYFVILLVLICLRDKRKRTGPTRKEIAMMISICAVFSIPLIVINLLMNVGLIGPIVMNSLMIVPLAMFLIVLYSLVLIAVYGTRK
ncbi:MAG: hypothetical protein ACFFCT_14280 [Candidatus Odinarchaeota archaeon]